MQDTTTDSYFYLLTSYSCPIIGILSRDLAPLKLEVQTLYVHLPIRGRALQHFDFYLQFPSGICLWEITVWDRGGGGSP
jgi:hypothetical protein